MSTHNPLSNRDLDAAVTLEEDDEDEKILAPNDAALTRETLSGVRALLLPAAPLLAVAFAAGLMGLISMYLVASSASLSGHDLVSRRLAAPRPLEQVRVLVCIVGYGVGAPPLLGGFAIDST
jgi:hypothetical protein